MGNSSILIGSVSANATFRLTVTGSSSVYVVMLMRVKYGVSQLKSKHFVHVFSEEIRRIKRKLKAAMTFTAS